MPKTPKSLDLISRYLNNSTSPTLQKEIAEFRSSSSENDTYFLEVEKIWHQSVSASRLEGSNAEESAQRLHQSLAEHTLVPRLGYITWFRSIAAAILLTAIGYWIYNQTNNIEYITKVTANNQVDSVRLNDGSIIILAGNSELKYPEKFVSDIREISLINGQAFFKITKDAKHPFKVVLNQSDVVVLGTSFNIKKTDDKIELGCKDR
jgi:transmembrane sensor